MSIHTKKICGEVKRCLRNLVSDPSVWMNICGQDRKTPEWSTDNILTSAWGGNGLEGYEMNAVPQNSKSFSCKLK